MRNPEFTRCRKLIGLSGSAGFGLPAEVTTANEVAETGPAELNRPMSTTWATPGVGPTLSGVQPAVRKSVLGRR